MTPYPGSSIYNQDRMSDDQFAEGFVARLDLLDHLLNILRKPGPGGEIGHQIIVGQRGMGKSTLLRRIAIGITRDTDLRSRFIPLRFREEQYNVIALGAFWRNCSEALAEWCEANGQAGLADRIDRALAGPPRQDADAAVAGFLDQCHDAGGRPVLLVDNLDLILDNLSVLEQWGLRRILQRSDGPIIIGAATRFLAQSGDRDAAFYEFFHPHLLEPLGEAEVMRCMHALADRRGAAGAPVRQVLAREPERLRTLYALTGGNPRVLALLYRIIESSESDTVFADLEALLDQVTPYYKARIEDYATPQQRAVIDAIALHWDPIASRDLSEATAIEVTTISSHLTRLKKDGFVQEVPTSNSRSGYQLTERFLNIWYLMRHGTRRTRQKLQWLTRFLARLYGPEDLGRMAAEARDGPSCAWHPYYREAVIAAYDEISGISGRAGSAGDLSALEPTVSMLTDEAGITATAGISPSLESALSLAEAAWNHYSSGDFSAMLAALDAILSKFSGATESGLLEQVAKALFNKGYCLGALGRADDAIGSYDAVVERFGGSTEPVLLEQVARALVNKGVRLGALGRADDMIATYDAVVERFGGSTELALLEPVAKALVNKGFCLDALGRVDDAIASYDAVVERFGGAAEPALLEPVARALLSKGHLLAFLDRNRDAIVVFDEMTALFFHTQEPRILDLIIEALISKGNVLFDRLGDPESAEAAYRACLARAPSSLLSKANLAWLYVMTRRLEQAVELRSELAELEAAGLALLDAGIALAGDNFGSAVDRLDEALGIGPEGGGMNFLDGTLRFLRLADACGYGEKLIGWLEASGHGERHSPLQAAFVAFVRGERFLLDVNPEVRRPAKQLYDRLSAPRRASAGGGDPAPKTPAPRRTRRRRSA